MTVQANSKTKATQELISVDPTTSSALAKIEQLAGSRELKEALRAGAGLQLEAALTVALHQEQMELLCSREVMRPVMLQQNQQNGFLTDKKEGYKEDVVRKCFVLACLKGARPINNEWNIIAGKTYLTVEFYRRAIRELGRRGLTDVDIVFGVPHMANNGALVPAVAHYKVDGVMKEDAHVDATDFDGRIPVKVNAGMGIDAIVGKARRKLLKDIYDKFTGTVFTEPDDGVTVDDVTSGGEVLELKND